jgi:hypothetical protein
MQIAQWHKKVVLVVNQIDLRSEAELAEVSQHAAWCEPMSQVVVAKVLCALCASRCRATCRRMRRRCWVWTSRSASDHASSPVHTTLCLTRAKD